jgi:hypothetical protein
MPTPTYTALATVTLASATSTVTFSNIPATYRDLIFIYNGTSVSASVEFGLRYNNDSGNTYTSVFAVGDGSATGSGTATRTYDFVGVAQTNRTQNMVSIMDYSATDKHKTTLTRNSIPASGVRMCAGRWPSTSAITSISALVGGGSNWAVGSTFDLYGVIA